MEKTYDVYHHPVYGYRAVKNGFSWPALLLGASWMVYKRMWALGTGWFVLQLLSNVMYIFPDRFVSVVGFVALVALWLLPGFRGNDWVRSNLSRREFCLERCVKAANVSDALSRGARANWVAKRQEVEIPVAYGKVPSSLYR